MRAHLWLTLTNVLKADFVKTNKKRVQVGSCNIINPCLCPHVMFCLLKSNKPTKHSKAQSMSESDKTSGANSKFIDEMWSSTCGVIIHNDGWLHKFSVCRKTKRSTSFWGCCRSFCNIDFWFCKILHSLFFQKMVLNLLYLIYALPFQPPKLHMRHRWPSSQSPSYAGMWKPPRLVNTFYRHCASHLSLSHTHCSEH